MCFFFSFLPATFWLVVGYFVLYSASRADGWIEVFGRVLATWIFVICGMILLLTPWRFHEGWSGVIAVAGAVVWAASAIVAKILARIRSAGR